MKHIYIQKDIENNFLELDFELAPSIYRVGVSITDYLKGMWVKLSEDQVRFKKGHPNASAEEVYNMDISKPTEAELLEKAKVEKKLDLERLNVRDYFQYEGKFVWLTYYERLQQYSNINIARKNGVSNIKIEFIFLDLNSAEYLLDVMTNCEIDFTSAKDSIINRIDECKDVQSVEAITFDFNIRNITAKDIAFFSKKAYRNSPEQQLLALAEYTINTMQLTDDQSIEVKLLYPEWNVFVGHALKTGTKVLYKNRIYKVRQDIDVVLENHFPSIDTAALYEEINEKHAGTIEDPIPYNNNMRLELNKYYYQDGLYLCFRDSEIPVYNNLAELIDLYVREVE